MMKKQTKKQTKKQKHIFGLGYISDEMQAFIDREVEKGRIKEIKEEVIKKIRKDCQNEYEERIKNESLIIEKRVRDEFKEKISEVDRYKELKDRLDSISEILENYYD